LAQRILAGVDGGGTKTLVALADESGRELVRHTGPAGLVDPRHPTAAAEVVAAVVREAVAAAGLAGTPAVLCAGLAGVGNRAEREAVRGALLAAGVAARVEVVTDGETALEGSLGGEAGILLIAGTGSVAYGRGPDGRVERWREVAMDLHSVAEFFAQCRYNQKEPRVIARSVIVKSRQCSGPPSQGYRAHL